MRLFCSGKDTHPSAGSGSLDLPIALNLGGVFTLPFLLPNTGYDITLLDLWAVGRAGGNLLARLPRAVLIPASREARPTLLGSLLVGSGL